MKVKMLEHYQDSRVHYFPEQVVDADVKLAQWLLEHRKAVAVIEETVVEDKKSEEKPRPQRRIVK